MFASAALALFALLPAALAQANAITVASPASVVTCEPVSLSWTGGVAPYFVSLIPGGQPGSAALESFPTSQTNSFVWTVNLAAQTSITIQVRDNDGNVQYSSPITIQAGPDSSCVGQSASVSAGGSATASSPSTGSTSSAAGTSPTTSAAVAPGTSAPASSSASVSAPASVSASSASHSSSSMASTSSSASKASTSPSASPSSGASASFQVGAFSVAGLAGLVGALLF